MSCCGSRRTRSRERFPSSSHGLHGARPTPVPTPFFGSDGLARREARFQYVGRTGLTVRGGATGRSYRFPRPGAVIGVDRRDRVSLRRVPVLREVG